MTSPTAFFNFLLTISISLNTWLGECYFLNTNIFRITTKHFINAVYINFTHFFFFQITGNIDTDKHSQTKGPLQDSSILVWNNQNQSDYLDAFLLILKRSDNSTCWPQGLMYSKPNILHILQLLYDYWLSERILPTPLPLSK